MYIFVLDVEVFFKFIKSYFDYCYVEFVLFFLMIMIVFWKSLYIYVYVFYFMDFKERNYYVFLLSIVSNIWFISYIEFKCIKGIMEIF